MSPDAPGTSSDNPAPIGVTVKTTVERGDAYMGPRLYNVEITLLEILRGNQAWEQVKSSEVVKEPSKSGFEYILARLKFGFFRRARGLGEDTYKLPDGQFIAASTDGKIEYENPPILKQPHPQLVDWLFKPGDIQEGWVVLQVPEDNKKPLLIFKRQHAEGVYGIWGYVWFQLY